MAAQRIVGLHRPPVEALGVVAVREAGEAQGHPAARGLGRDRAEAGAQEGQAGPQTARVAPHGPQVLREAPAQPLDAQPLVNATFDGTSVTMTAQAPATTVQL